LAFQHFTAPQIREIISNEVEEIGANPLPGFSLEIPELRTVQRLAKAVRDQDRHSDQDAWSMEGNPDSLDVALLLDTLSEVVTRTEGRVTRFNNQQAVWLNRIRESTTGLSGWGAWVLYKLCVEADPESETGLDLILGFRPWENTERFDKLSSLIKEKRIREPVCWSFIKTRMPLMRNGIFIQGEENER
jgi:hypothetical protein